MLWSAGRLRYLESCMYIWPWVRSTQLGSTREYMGILDTIGQRRWFSQNSKFKNLLNDFTTWLASCLAFFRNASHHLTMLQCLCKDTFNIHSFICRKETDCQSRVRERSSVTHSHSWPCRCRNATGGAERECDGNITSRTSDQRLDHLNPFESITIWGWRGTSRVFECHRDVESSWVIHSSIRFRHWRVWSWWPKGATSRHIPQKYEEGLHSQQATQCNSYHANIWQIDAKYTSI